MEKIEAEKTYTAVTINLRLRKECNEVLAKAAKRAGRTKRREAELRLEDHLMQYQDIAIAGKRFKR